MDQGRAAGVVAGVAAVALVVSIGSVAHWAYGAGVVRGQQDWAQGQVLCANPKTKAVTVPPKGGCPDGTQIGRAHV